MTPAATVHLIDLARNESLPACGAWKGSMQWTSEPDDATCPACLRLVRAPRLHRYLGDELSPSKADRAARP
jgi:hypothetical protein